MKSLITKLNGIVDDSNILKIGELRIYFNPKTTSYTGRKLTLIFTEDTTITCVGGYFSDSALSENKGTIMSIPAQQMTDIYVVGDEGYLSIPNGRYKLSLINSKQSIYSVEVADLNYNPDLFYVVLRQSPMYGDIKNISRLTNLTTLDLFLSKVSGDISVVANFKKLTDFSVARTSISGDIGSLSKLTELRSVTIDSQDVYGDIAAFANSINLTNLYIPRLPNIHGSVEDLAEKMRNAGRTSGTLSLTTDGSNVTFNGSRIGSKKITFTSSGVSYSD